jgi:hypothetical protein
MLIEKDGGGVGAGVELGCRAVPVGEGVHRPSAHCRRRKLAFVVVYTTWARVPGI